MILPCIFLTSHWLWLAVSWRRTGLGIALVRSTHACWLAPATKPSPPATHSQKHTPPQPRKPQTTQPHPPHHTPKKTQAHGQKQKHAQRRQRSSQWRAIPEEAKTNTQGTASVSPPGTAARPALASQSQGGQAEDAALKLSIFFFGDFAV